MGGRSKLWNLDNFLRRAAEFGKLAHGIWHHFLQKTVGSSIELLEISQQCQIKLFVDSGPRVRITCQKLLCSNNSLGIKHITSGFQFCCPTNMPQSFMYVINLSFIIFIAKHILCSDGRFPNSKSKI